MKALHFVSIYNEMDSIQQAVDRYAFTPSKYTEESQAVPLADLLAQTFTSTNNIDHLKAILLREGIVVTVKKQNLLDWLLTKMNFVIGTWQDIPGLAWDVNAMVECLNTSWAGEHINGSDPLQTLRQKMKNMSSARRQQGLHRRVTHAEHSANILRVNDISDRKASNLRIKPTTSIWDVYQPL